MFCFQLPSLQHPDAHLWRQFSCCCCQYPSRWCLSAPSPPNCLAWITLYPIFRQVSLQTLQHQLHLVLRFRSRTTKQQSRTKIVIWHDVINNSLTPHSSNFNRLLSPSALIQELCTLPCDIAAVVHCQRTGSPDIFKLLRQSFLVMSPVRHLLSHRKQNNPALVRQYSALHLAAHLEL